MTSYKSPIRGFREKETFPRRFPAPQNPEASLPEPKAEQVRLQGILIEDLRNEDRFDKGCKPQIKDVSYLASYNWLDSAAATILVPGKPPRWLGSRRSRKLKEDSDVYFRDPNGARYPEYPTEPAVQAILKQNPAFQSAGIDIFGCGNTFGTLLGYSRNQSRTFRFGVERIGSTLFLVRKSNTPRELIEDVRGYGHTFPESYTTWDSQVRGSASHQRLIRYDFMGLKCIIRSESDGFLPDQSPAPEMRSHGGLKVSPSTDSIGSNIMSLNIGLRIPTAGQQLLIREAGQVVPQTAVFDLKTRSIKRKDSPTSSMEEFYPRLWANQTPNFILAFHDRGIFEPANIAVNNVQADVQAWEARNAGVLEDFGRLLAKLLEISKIKGQSSFEIRRTGTGPLEVWSEVSTWSALPDALKLLWKSGEEDEETAKE